MGVFFVGGQDHATELVSSQDTLRPILLPVYVFRAVCWTSRSLLKSQFCGVFFGFKCQVGLRIISRDRYYQGLCNNILVRRNRRASRKPLRTKPKEVSEAAVTAAGMRIVKLLVGNPPQTVSDLIETTNVTRTAVTEQLNELAAAGFVERTVERLPGRGRPRHLYQATPAALLLLFASNQRLVVPAIWQAIDELGGEKLTRGHSFPGQREDRRLLPQRNHVPQIPPSGCASWPTILRDEGGLVEVSGLPRATGAAQAKLRLHQHARRQTFGVRGRPAVARVPSSAARSAASPAGTPAILVALLRSAPATGPPDRAAAPVAPRVLRLRFMHRSRRGLLVAFCLALASIGGYLALDWWIALPEGQVAKYVGRSSCAGCHEQEARKWSLSDHAQAMALATPATVLGDFEHAQFTHFGVTSTMFRRGDRFFVTTDGPSGRMETFAIKYTFGYRPLQQYLVEFPDGRVQCLPLAWDTQGKRWFHLYPNEAIPWTDELHWTKPLQNWNYMLRRLPLHQSAEKLYARDRPLPHHLFRDQREL